MVIRLDDFVANLPEEEQWAIREGTAKLIAEEATLRQLRAARERSQIELARTLKINKAAVSKLERRTDMYLNALRGCIEAMGGRLEIVARFPDQAVPITQFGALGPVQGPGDRRARTRPVARPPCVAKSRMRRPKTGPAKTG